jgi:hypothetical protein
MVVGKSKKKPQRCDLRLLPDARMLVWGAGTDVAEGDAVDLTDIKGICPVGVRQLRIDTAKAGQFFFTFGDQPTANTWQEIFTNVVEGRLRG